MKKQQLNTSTLSLVLSPGPLHVMLNTVNLLKMKPRKYNFMAILENPMTSSTIKGYIYQVINSVQLNNIFQIDANYSSDNPQGKVYRFQRVNLLTCYDVAALLVFLSFNGSVNSSIKIDLSGG